MILVDTSIWIDHLRAGDRELMGLLEANRVIVHPFVAGELACGKLRNRQQILRLLTSLPQAPVATHEEVLAFIEHQSLMEKGIGYTDVHLLAAVSLHGAAQLWARDGPLEAAATLLGCAHIPAGG